MLAYLRNKLFGGFGKQKPVVFHCYTFSEAAFNFAPIQRSSKFLPNWWKTLAKKPDDDAHPTMKYCAGFKYLYEKSFTLPMWTDFNMIIQRHEAQFFMADSATQVDLHPPEQRGDFAPEQDTVHVKILSPWTINCDEEVYCAWTPPTWGDEISYDIQLLSGVLEFKHQSATNINLLIKKDDTQKSLKIALNEPLVHIVPMTERPFKVVLHLVSMEEWEKKKSKFLPVWTNRYGRTKKHSQQCPYKHK